MPYYTQVLQPDEQVRVIGRLWNYGTVLIHGTGSGFEPLVGIGAPIQIRNAIVAV